MHKNRFLGLLVLSVVMSGLSSCTSSVPNVTQVLANPSPVAVPSPEPSPTLANEIAVLVANQNEYRFAEGQDPLTAGLDCGLYTVPQSTTAIIGATLTSVGNFTFLGTFNQPNTSVTSGLNILPSGLEGTYETWYVVRCTGTLFVADDNWHDFSLTSDDGANLYIDGLLINNDGLHGADTKVNSKLLQMGAHSFELDYFQGAGAEQLNLEEDGVVMSNVGYYH